ncbi:MAG: hypothetical protein ACRD29_24090 [Acidimicrobiales bacterium]
MGVHFEVQPWQLEDVSRRLLDAVAVADDVKNNRDALKAHLADPGDETFGGAASEFLDEWSYGCGCMTEDANQLAELLGQASAAYIEVEMAIAEGYEGSDGG